MMGEVTFDIRPLALSDWPVLETLFGGNGACGGCWCMYWRVPSTGQYWQDHKGEPNRRAFEALVRTGAAMGMLAFAEGEPAGWLSLGWKEEFAYLQRSPRLSGDTGNTMSVTCFFIPAAWRGRGLATALLTRAIDHARRLGAGYLEGYPSIPRSNARIPPAFAHTGVPEMFEAAGFERWREAGGRAIYRVSLSQ